MVKVIAHFYLNEGKADEAVKLAGELVEKTRKEDGCLQYDVVVQNDAPDHLVVLETWQSPEVLDIHSATEHFTRIVPQLAQLCAQPPKVEQYTQVL